VRHGPASVGWAPIVAAVPFALCSWRRLAICRLPPSGSQEHDHAAWPHCRDESLDSCLAINLEDGGGRLAPLAWMNGDGLPRFSLAFAAAQGFRAASALRRLPAALMRRRPAEAACAGRNRASSSVECGLNVCDLLLDMLPLALNAGESRGRNASEPKAENVSFMAAHSTAPRPGRGAVICACNLCLDSRPAIA
jgi:hypothetical protein